MIYIIRCIYFGFKRYLLICAATLALVIIEAILTNVAQGLLHIPEKRVWNATQYILECDCERPFFYPKSDQKLNTSCSDEGTHYASDQKVVSYSLFFCDDEYAGCKTEIEGRKELFAPGMTLNLAKVREHYPGYSVRIYTKEKIRSYCTFLCGNPDVFWCDVSRTPSHGDLRKIYPTLWRHLPLGDPTVEHFLSRDLDSLISRREASTVNEWLQLNKAIHVLRDKQEESISPIMGGLWGARNNLLKDPTASELREDILNSTRQSIGGFGYDQNVLTRLIFNPRGKDIIAYDSYNCKYWANFTDVRPFPTQRENRVNDCVGCRGLGRKVYNLSICPWECRPSYGMNWEYC